VAADYQTLLPIDGRIFETEKGTWQARVTNTPNPVGTDRVCYMILFTLENGHVEPRRLKLWVSDVQLHHDADKKYQTSIFEYLKTWLEVDSNSEELEYFG
jgi:hypothetical protein